MRRLKSGGAPAWTSRAVRRQRAWGRTKAENSKTAHGAGHCRHGGPPQGLGLRMSRSSLGLLKKHSVCYDRIRLCGLRIKIERLIGAYDNNPTDDGGLLQD